MTALPSSLKPCTWQKARPDKQVSHLSPSLLCIAVLLQCCRQLQAPAADWRLVKLLGMHTGCRERQVCSCTIELCTFHLHVLHFCKHGNVLASGQLTAWTGMAKLSEIRRNTNCVAREGQLCNNSHFALAPHCCPHASPSLPPHIHKAGVDCLVLMLQLRQGTEWRVSCKPGRRRRKSRNCESLPCEPGLSGVGLVLMHLPLLQPGTPTLDCFSACLI